MREILGPLYSEHDVLVENQSCLPYQGCGYSPHWNMIQMDEPSLFLDDWDYGVVYAHELTHAIVIYQNKRLVEARQGMVERERASFLNNWSMVYRTSRVLETARRFGWRGYFRNAELQRNDLMALLRKKYASYFSLIDFESHPEKKPDSGASLFLKLSSEELLADLVSNAAHKDGNAIAKAIGRISKNRFEKRENPDVAQLPTQSKIVKVSPEEFHDTLQDARRVIWARYLKGKSGAESQNVFAALNQTETDWLGQAYSLLTVSQRDSKHDTEPSRDEFWYVDITALNMLFLEIFKSHLNR